MSHFAIDSLSTAPLVVLRIPQQRPRLQCYGFPSKGPSCTMWFRRFTKYDTKSVANPHSTEQDTQPISFLISKQAVPYWTRGDTCCPGVSTSMIRSLADSSTTCLDSINHLHHSNCCSNHNIDPHHGQLTSQRIEENITLTKTQAKLNITKDGNTCTTLKTAWLSITNHV
jgi:hypothetical protein